MKVFISWSGSRSQELAKTLREWLPLVLDYVEPWVSETDIAAGDRWAQAIGSELEESNFGIICITPENLTSPWVLFEAGALAKSMQDGKVIPLLFGLEYSDITDPLAQFQAKKVDQAGLGEVIQAIEKVTDKKDREDLIRRRFNGLWPDFEKLIEKIPDRAPTEKHMRPQTEILEELVTGVRGLDTRLHEFGSEIADREPRGYRRKLRRIHPKMFDELIHQFSHEEDDPIFLLMLGGMLREDMPWLAEVFVETYREVMVGGMENVERSIRRLRRVVKMTRKGHLIDELVMNESKDLQMMLMELPMMLDMTLNRYLNTRHSHENARSPVEFERNIVDDDNR